MTWQKKYEELVNDYIRRGERLIEIGHALNLYYHNEISAEECIRKISSAFPR